MKKIFFLLIAIFVCSCQTNKSNSTSILSYKTAHNYFVRNDYKIQEIVEKVITTKDEFNKFFENATFMGESGKPTPIDFSKENVIAILYQKTDDAVEIIPVKLEKSQTGECIYRYQVKIGDKRSFYVVPKLVIIVNKNIGKVTFKKE